MQYSRRTQKDAIRRALTDYYASHPKEWEEKQLRLSGEITVPSAIGAAIGTKLKRSSMPLAIGAGVSAGAATVGELIRRKKALEAMGLDVNYLTTTASPLTGQAREDYFDE